jgi:hypothetical protein
LLSRPPDFKRSDFVLSQRCSFVASATDVTLLLSPSPLYNFTRKNIQKLNVLCPLFIVRFSGSTQLTGFGDVVDLDSDITINGLLTNRKLRRGERHDPVGQRGCPAAANVWRETHQGAGEGDAIGQRHAIQCMQLISTNQRKGRSS